jgi:hypothetical protein
MAGLDRLEQLTSTPAAYAFQMVVCAFFAGRAFASIAHHGFAVRAVVIITGESVLCFYFWRRVKSLMWQDA